LQNNVEPLISDQSEEHMDFELGDEEEEVDEEEEEEEEDEEEEEEEERGSNKGDEDDDLSKMFPSIQKFMKGLGRKERKSMSLLEGKSDHSLLVMMSKLVPISAIRGYRQENIERRVCVMAKENTEMKQDISNLIRSHSELSDKVDKLTEHILKGTKNEGLKREMLKRLPLRTPEEEEAFFCDENFSQYKETFFEM